MYKKTIGFATVALLSIGAYLVTKANTTNETNMALEDLLRVNEANAECWDDGAGPLGGCEGKYGSVHGGICVFPAGPNGDCTHSAGG